MCITRIDSFPFVRSNRVNKYYNNSMRKMFVMNEIDMISLLENVNSYPDILYTFCITFFVHFLFVSTFSVENISLNIANTVFQDDDLVLELIIIFAENVNSFWLQFGYARIFSFSMTIIYVHAVRNITVHSKYHNPLIGYYCWKRMRAHKTPKTVTNLP